LNLCFTGVKGVDVVPKAQLNENMLDAFWPPRTATGVLYFDLGGGDEETLQPELEQLTLIKNAVRSFPTGIYILSYPIYAALPLSRNKAEILTTINKIGCKKILNAEIHFPNSMANCIGAGVIIINPPYRFDRLLREQVALMNAIWKKENYVDLATKIHPLCSMEESTDEQESVENKRNQSVVWLNPGVEESDVNLLLSPHRYALKISQNDPFYLLPWIYENTAIMEWIDRSRSWVGIEQRMTWKNLLEKYQNHGQAEREYRRLFAIKPQKINRPKPIVFTEKNLKQADSRFRLSKLQHGDYLESD